MGKLFAPTWPMVMGLKNGSTTKEQYTQAYNGILNNIFTGPAITSVLEDLAKAGRITLVCYCHPGDFCHRTLLAQYLQKMAWGTYMGELILPSHVGGN